MRTAPPHSPPSPKPCTRRSTTRAAGAATPTAPYVGSRPIANVARAHQHERQPEHRLAPDAVAVVPEDDAADGPRDEADRERREREQRPDERIEPREEEAREDERRGGPVEEEVVPLDRGADEGRHEHHRERQRGAAEGRQRPRRGVVEAAVGGEVRGGGRHRGPRLRKARARAEEFPPGSVVEPRRVRQRRRGGCRPGGATGTAHPLRVEVHVRRARLEWGDLVMSGPRRLLLALLVVAACACLGCARDPSVEIARWDLAVPGAPAQAVTLPGVLPLPDRPLGYVLGADVAVPPAMRGAAVSVVVDDTLARGSLRVDGIRALSCLPERIEGYRSDGAQCWHFTAPDAPSMRLDFDGAHTTPLTAVFDSVPRLVGAPDGGARFCALMRFADVTQLGSAFIAGLLAIFYAGAFVFDRSRVAHFWFALQAFGGMVYPLWWSGALQPLLGSADRFVLVEAMLLGGYASLRFTHEQLGVGPVPRAWRAVIVLGALTGIAQIAAFPPRALPIATAAFISLPTAGVVAVCVRAFASSRDRSTAAVIGLTWLALLVSAPFEVPALIGMQAHEAGVRVMPLALAVVGLGQGALLARRHVTSLRDADVLNAELRRQIAERSSQLAEALARLDLPGERWLAPGDVVAARYRVVRPLGAGGMGEVYEVERLADGKRLALKLVRGEATRTQLARFAREAQIAAKIVHPNLVAVADVDLSTDHGLFLVMELVGGGSLADQHARFGDEAWALEVLRQVSAGLVALHDGGVVHRDLKPENVLLENGGTLAKISDFGIASMAEARTSLLASTVGGGDFTMRAADMTRTGMILGTPRYMAPELAKGSKHASTAVDVFALGVLACELLDLGYPFGAPPIVDAIYGRAVRRTRTIAQALGHRDGLGPLLDACLEEEPARRPTARQLVDALAPR